MSEPTRGVAYLARRADGIDAFRRFVESYRRHPAGVEHELIVIYKGFAQQSDLNEARALFDLPHLGIELEDVGFDIGAYLEASRRVSHDYLLFLNTHSEISRPGWLARLSDYALRSGVGLAGAMGSYESIRDTVLLLKTVLWKCLGVGSAYDAKLAYYFDFVLGQHHPEWFGPSGEVVPPSGRRRGWTRKIRMAGARALRYPWFLRKGAGLIWPGAPAFDLRQFPAFPNPHIRSNGFMIRRKRLLDLGLPEMTTKADASLFESGALSLTARLRHGGLAAVVVGNDGRGYDVEDWWRSGTFRLGDQNNLLFGDNHTRAFPAMTAGARATHVRMTWGDYLGPAPRDFPELGFGFRKGEIVPAVAGQPATHEVMRLIKSTQRDRS